MRLIPPTLTLAGALAMFAAAGCTQESNPGGPGVASAPRTTSSTTTTSTTKPNGMSRQEVVENRETQKPVVTDKANTFTLHAPKMETSLQPGKTREIEISISRGTAFKQSVKLEFKPPVGVTVAPAMATIPAGQDKVTVTVEATNGAPVGKAQIQVTAVPDTGKSVSLEVPVEIKHT